jgi:hypothetical protein
MSVYQRLIYKLSRRTEKYARPQEPKEDAPTHRHVAKHYFVPIHPSALIGVALDQGPSVLANLNPTAKQIIPKVHGTWRTQRDTV